MAAQVLSCCELECFHSKRPCARKVKQTPFKCSATYAYVTTKKFMEVFGLASLRDLPDIEKLEDAGLLQRPASETDLDGVLGLGDGHPELVDEIDEN
jgi:hypothetical protein